MTVLFRADFSGQNDSAKAGFSPVHRQNEGGALNTAGIPIPSFNHPVMGNCLEHTLAAGVIRAEALPPKRTAVNGETRYYRFDFAVPTGFPLHQSNYFLIISQIHSGGTNSPPLEFDLYGGGLWTRGYNWTTGQYNQFRHKVCDVNAEQVYSIAFSVKYSTTAANNKVSVWVNGVLALDDLSPGYPLLETPQNQSYWKGSSLYADATIARPLTVYQANHVIGTALSDVLISPPRDPDDLPPPEDPEPSEDGTVAMPDDFLYAEVQLSDSPDFTTFRVVDGLKGKGQAIATDLEYGRTYWTRFVAIDSVGNRSEPSEAVTAVPEKIVDIDLGPDAVGEAQIRNLAVGRAAIQDLAVNSAKIADLEAGKLTAGSLTAEVITVGGRLATGTDPSNRVTLDSLGLYSIVGGSLKMWIRNNGDALLTGQVQSALSGVRWEGRPDGEFRFYKQNNLDYAVLKWDEPNNKIDIRGPQTGLGWDGSDTNAGRLSIGKHYAGLSWGQPSYLTSRIEANNTSTQIHARILGNSMDARIVGDGTQNRVFWMFYDGAGIGHSLLHLEGHAYDGNDRRPMLRHPAGNAGLCFGFNRLQAKTFQNTFTDFEADHIQCNSLGQNSSRLLKHDIQTPEFNAREVVRNLRVKQFKMNANPDGAMRYGWIAEDAEEVLPDLVIVGLDDYKAIDTGGAIGFSLKLGEENSEAIDDLQRQIDELRGPGRTKRLGDTHGA